jgi:cell wall-associated NlpC family hydrolase
MHFINHACIDLKVQPDMNSGTETQILLGESVDILHNTDTDFCLVQIKQNNDFYKGYILKQYIDKTISHITHRVITKSTLLFNQPNIKSAMPNSISFGACLNIIQDIDAVFYKTFCGRYALKKHLIAQDNFLPFSVDNWIACLHDNFYHTPYLWGGRSSEGIDCSGLLQLSLQAFGIFLPRDTGPQENYLSQNIALEDIGAGDIVFWKGHVGIMINKTNIIHANAYHMKVLSEPLSDVIRRSKLPISAIKSIQYLL